MLAAFQDARAAVRVSTEALHGSQAPHEQDDHDDLEDVQAAAPAITTGEAAEAGAVVRLGAQESAAGHLGRCSKSFPIRSSMRAKSRAETPTSSFP